MHSDSTHRLFCVVLTHHTSTIRFYPSAAQQSFLADRTLVTVELMVRLSSVRLFVLTGKLITRLLARCHGFSRAKFC